MTELVARAGRQQQRYEAGCRLVAGERNRPIRESLHLLSKGAHAPGIMNNLSCSIMRCIPFKYRSFADNEDGKYEKNVEVLMINANSGPGLLFPKGGWENDETVEEAAAREALEEAGVRGDLLHFLGQYEFKSKTLQYKFSPEGLCKASMFALLVKEELQCWPEQNTRQRSWLTIPEAGECCRYKWMKDALEEGFTKWLDDQMVSRSKMANDVNSSASSPEKH